MESLSHTKYEVGAQIPCGIRPEIRRKTLYAQLRKHLGEVFRRLAEQKGKPDRGGASHERSRAHDDCDPAKIRRVASDRLYYRLYQGGRARLTWRGLRRATAETCGEAFLGARILRVYGRGMRR